ncbi:hypothetical protein TYRP_001600 [Tyrophagus putrescentiae]|nr:hypothetical protein TYRP_001600 [Tyrophagus putrescentiae]
MVKVNWNRNMILERETDQLQQDQQYSPQLFHLSQQQECGVQFKLDFLHTHTELRRRHGVPPLEPDYDDFQARSETALDAIIRAHDDDEDSRESYVDAAAGVTKMVMPVRGGSRKQPSGDSVVRKWYAPGARGRYHWSSGARATRVGVSSVVATLAAFWLPFTTYLLLFTYLFPLELTPNEADGGGGQLIFSFFAIVAIAMAYYALVRDFVVSQKHLEPLPPPETLLYAYFLLLSSVHRFVYFLLFVLEVTGAPEVKHSPLWTLGLPAAAVLGYTQTDLNAVSVTSLSNGIEIINTTSSSITSSFRCFSLLGIPVYLLLMLLYYSAFTTVYLLDRSFDQLKTALKTKVLPALEFLLLLGAQLILLNPVSLVLTAIAWPLWRLFCVSHLLYSCCFVLADDLYTELDCPSNSFDSDSDSDTETELVYLRQERHSRLGLGNIGRKASLEVARRTVVAHNVQLIAGGVLRTADAHLAAALPHHLRKVAPLGEGAHVGLVAIVVLPVVLDLVVPRLYGDAAVRQWGVLIRRPAHVQVLAVLVRLAVLEGI